MELDAASARTGISPDRLAGIEDQRLDPWFREMVRIAEVYGVALSEIARLWSLEPRRGRRGGITRRRGRP